MHHPAPRGARRAGRLLARCASHRRSADVVRSRSFRSPSSWRRVPRRAGLRDPRSGPAARSVVTSGSRTRRSVCSWPCPASSPPSWSRGSPSSPTRDDAAAASCSAAAPRSPVRSCCSRLRPTSPRCSSPPASCTRPRARFVVLAQATWIDIEPAAAERTMARWVLVGSIGAVVGPVAWVAVAVGAGGEPRRPRRRWPRSGSSSPSFAAPFPAPHPEIRAPRAAIRGAAWRCGRGGSSAG